MLSSRRCSAEEAASPAPPPVVVLQPDGEHICTARMDAEWAAALAAAQHGEQADKPAGLPAEQQPQGGTPAAAGVAAAGPAARPGSWWARLQRRRQATAGQVQREEAAVSPAAASVELPHFASVQQAPPSAASGSIAASSSTDRLADVADQPAEQQPQPLELGMSRRHSADSGAAAGNRQAAAGQWAGPSRSRRSGGRQRPVPMYDIDLGQPPADPAHGVAAAERAEQPPSL